MTVQNDNDRIATLEKRNELQGALEAYKKSLEAEWNQPPTIEAVNVS